MGSIVDGYVRLKAEGGVVNLHILSSALQHLDTLPIRLEAMARVDTRILQGSAYTMDKIGKQKSDADGWANELLLLESLRWSRKEFADRVCDASRSDKSSILETLRLEATYQLAEFLFLLHAQGIETVADIKRLAELHNQYVVDLMKDQQKMQRLGLSRERALDGMFTSDTLPRLLQNWEDGQGAIDQSNLARLLMSVMSTETCRKVVVACAEAGFLERRKTAYGTMLVHTTGRLESIFGQLLRDLRFRIRDC